MRSTPKPELLCPAGSPAALAAAIEGGADAVYLGATAFNARMGAKNFTPEELREGIKLAHAYGVRVYLTANTLIYDKEADDLLCAAEDAYLAGADGLIVADIGAAQLIHSRIPIELHASTQLSGHNADAAKELAAVGFSRMVCAREMSRDDLLAFVKNSPIEAEVFVHGALCVCHSGQCLFSSLVGGRSGNRGECAQPCRLPYTKDGRQCYPLSLKDLSLARHVPELCDMGIASFKIEGRMKSPEYVREVASLWRQLIDEHRGADGREMERLAAVFSRGGFTDGYYRGTVNHGMLGIRSDSDKQQSRSLAPFVGLTKKIPLTFEAELSADRPVSLTVLGAQGRRVTVYGDIPQAARTAPLDEPTVRRCLSKLGNTPYTLDGMSVTLDDGLMLPISALNALRRRALDAWETPEGAGRSADDFKPVPAPPKPEPTPPMRSAIFYEPDRIPREAYDFFDLLYTPVERFCGNTAGVLLPPVIFDSERGEIEALLTRAKQNGARYALVGNPGHLALVRSCGLIPRGEFRLNVTNRYALSFWQRQGLESCTLSPELTLPRLRDLGGSAEVIVYGRIPLMVTEKCVGRELGDCAACTEGSLHLTDRRGVEFPVLRAWKHRSLILNSVPVYMADRAEELKRLGLLRQQFLFTVESKQQILQVLQAYESGRPPMGDIRRLK